jgi:glucose-1-phosphate adenylyltransferase
VGANAIVGFGENFTVANQLKPSHLYTGITLIGKGAVVPAAQKIGRNCVINSNITEASYPGKTIEDGESLFADGEVS